MAVTWTKLPTISGGTVMSERSVQAACTSGTEAQALAATDGMNLAGVDSYIVVVSAIAAQTLSGAGTLFAYYYDPAVGRWARSADYDLTVAAGTASNRDAVFKGPAVGLGMIVNCQRGRLAYTPNGVTVSSGGIVIQMLASSQRGIS